MGSGGSTNLEKVNATKKNKMKKRIIEEDSSEDDAPTTLEALNRLMKPVVTNVKKPAVKKAKKVKTVPPFDPSHPQSMVKRKVRIPASAFPEENPPEAGYWVAVIRLVLLQPKGHLMLKVSGEEPFHRSVEEVAKWEPHS